MTGNFTRPSLLVSATTAALLLSLAACFSPVYRALAEENNKIDADKTANRASQIFTEELAKTVLGCGVKANTSNNSQDEVTGEAWVSRAGYSASSSSRPVPQLTLLIRHAKSANQAKNIFDSCKSAYGGTDVDGLGAPAYRTKVPAQLNVLVGKNWLVLSAGTFIKPDKEIQEKLAKELISKIGTSSLD